MAGRLQVGHLVAVPFRTQQLAGVVVALSDSSPVEKTRPIVAILDSIPVLTPAQIELARWLSREYLAPLAACIPYFLPPGANRKPEIALRLTPAGYDAGQEPLAAPEQILRTYLRRYGATPLAKLNAAAAEGLLAKGLAEKEALLSPPQVGPKIDRLVELLIPPDEVEATLPTLGHESKQAALLLHLTGLDDPRPVLADVLAAVGSSKGYVKSLAQKGWFELILDDPERITLTLPPAQVDEVVIHLRGAEKHAAVLRLLAAEQGPLWIGWIYAQTGATLQTLRDLAEANLIRLDEARRWRDPMVGKSFTLANPPQLTAEQQTVWQTLLGHWQPADKTAPRPILLHGVTGSGKTEIYLRAILRALQAGQEAMLLVPEITLATQVVERVSARFPGRVAIWHSALSPGERYDTWERVRAGHLPIVVGPRSALFAPTQNLGLIILDEEHEPAYKQDHLAPTYHAREAALELARLSGALVILGSATPDVGTYRRAERGEYKLLTLPHRVLAHTQHLAVQQAILKQRKKPPRFHKADPGTLFVTLPLPEVEIVDLRDELKAGNRTIFSRALQDAIRDTLNKEEQIILFLNRRGAASFVVCRDCGYVMRCRRCETTLTYHTAGELMVCHYCGRREKIPVRCPDCHRERIRYFGLGTQRVEEAVKSLFPQAKPIRWDWDTTRHKGSHGLFLEDFMAGRANVMVGTQMIAKGLDLPLVTLVGVISADTGLYLPDFRAGERTFQLLMQVAGRAGRSPLGGRVIIQTYTPDQGAIVTAAGHDYESFYQQELKFRWEQRYPPFKRVALLLYSGPGPARSEAEAEQLAERLRAYIARQGLPAVDVIGPTPNYVRRVGSQYRWHIILRAQDPAGVLRPLMPLPYGWRVDIDPMTLV
jgi:primosomal protein N' (replication factor Y)